MHYMKRRAFISLLGGAAAAWPLAARAQRGERVRRIGVLMSYIESDSEAIDKLARESNAGLIVLPGAQFTTAKELIIATAARLRLPAMYPYTYWVKSGGLISYGFDAQDMYRRAASYVDRILRGARVQELPVQNPVKFELAINLKTAKALGLDVPPMLLARADEVIE
jgi:putative tryptophan/tyrosine transport system substrate-binding protein